jgi:hypothetical protein
MNAIHCLLAAATITSAAFAQQNLVLPDNHYLTESATHSAAGGSANWWRNGPGRFQIIYEATHFTNVGAVGPIVITKLRFRGEDGEANLGGQVYTGVTVELGSTSVNAAAMSTTFASNRLAATTTMAPAITTDVTVAPSIGSVPNNDCIEIDLLTLGGPFIFDPTSAQPNLIIDITVPNAPSNPAPLALIPIQDTTTKGAGIRGRGVYATTAGATTGTSSTTPPVVGLAFAGPGGYATLQPAVNERYGAACGGSPSAFYQQFQHGQAWDLQGLTLLPDNNTAPNFYIVTPGAPPVDVTQLNAAPNSTGDDAVVTHTLGFTFRYPGGSTTTIKPSTNGFVWLSGTPTDSDYTPTVAEMLGGTTTAFPARLALFWHDLHAGRNTPTHPNSGLHVKTDTSGGAGNAVCYATWYDVGAFRTPSGTTIGGHMVYRFQCVLHEVNGMVQFRYDVMPPFVAHWSTVTDVVHAMVGFSRGRIGTINSVDPQSRDLSLESPFTTAIEGSTGNIGHTVTTTPEVGGAVYMGRLHAGQTALYNATNVPAGSLICAQLLDVAASRPGLQLPGITAPGCMLSTSPNALLWEVFVTPASSTVNGTRPLTIPAGIDGTELYSQFVVLNGLVVGGSLVSSSSNAVRQRIGQN